MIADIPNEKLADFIFLHLRNMWTVDGLYFIGIEEDFSTKAATEIDKRVWKAMGRIEARRLKKFFKISRKKVFYVIIFPLLLYFLNLCIGTATHERHVAVFLPFLSILSSGSLMIIFLWIKKKINRKITANFILRVVFAFVFIYSLLLVLFSQSYFIRITPSRR